MAGYDMLADDTALLDLLLERAKMFWSFRSGDHEFLLTALQRKKKGCWTEVINRHSTKKCKFIRKKLQIFLVCAIEKRSCETGLKKNLLSDCSPQQVNHDIRKEYKSFEQC